MPSDVLISITVSTELGISKLTVTVALPTPSSTVISLIVTVGVASLSVMVPVPVSLLLVVLPLVTVPDSVIVSVGSSILSSIVVTLTVIDVCPAGMVTVVVVICV